MQVRPCVVQLFRFMHIRVLPPLQQQLLPVQADVLAQRAAYSVSCTQLMVVQGSWSAQYSGFCGICGNWHCPAAVQTRSTTTSNACPGNCWQPRPQLCPTMAAFVPQLPLGIPVVAIAQP